MEKSKLSSGNASILLRTHRLNELDTLTCTLTKTFNDRSSLDTYYVLSHWIKVSKDGTNSRVRAMKLRIVRSVVYHLLILQYYVYKSIAKNCTSQFCETFIRTRQGFHFGTYKCRNINIYTYIHIRFSIYAARKYIFLECFNNTVNDNSNNDKKIHSVCSAMFKFMKPWQKISLRTNYPIKC